MNIVAAPEFYGFQASPEAPPFAWVPLLLSFLRRRWRIIFCGVACCMALGGAYVALATPLFTATTQILIDTRQGNAFQLQASSIFDSAADNAIVDSQVEVLRSDGTARHVVTTLQLTEDAEFLSWGSSLPRAVLGRIALWIEPVNARAPALEDDATRATERLQAMTAIRRIGLSNVIEVSVRSPSPTRSAQWANALTAAYVGEALRAKYDITRMAGAWLQDRLKELRDQSTAADRALEEQKARIGIVDTDKGGMNEQALGDLTLQLSNARARTAETAARYTRIQAITAAGLASPGSVVDALANTVILKLQQQYLDDARRAVEWKARFGPQHAAVTALTREMAGLQASLGDELRRIQETYRSDYDVARGNEAALQAQIDQLVAISTATNGARAQTRALESLADTYRRLYGSFLQRYTEAAQDQSFPISQARTISPAIPPLRRSAPATLLVLLGSMAAGLTAGFAAGLLREVTDRRFHTAAQVREVTGLDCIGLLPRARLLRRRAPLRAAVDAPQSPFAAAMRTLQARLTRRGSRTRPNQVIGIVSAVAGEGRSTVAANLALVFAVAGSRTILIGCNTGAAPDGVAPAVIDDLVQHDLASSLAFLSAPSMLEAKALIGPARTRFDTVVLDLPPLGAIANVSAFIDGFIIVLAWSQTQQHVVVDALEAADLDSERLLGVVLNKVDLAASRRFSPEFGRQYRPFSSEGSAA